MDLIIIIIASALLIPLAIFTDGLIRIVLGLLFVLFFPGYSLMSALFPRKAEKWEQRVSFTPTRDEPDQKVEFLLYKDNRQLYQSLHLWIDIKGDASDGRDLQEIA